MKCIHSYKDFFTSGKWSASTESPLCDLRQDFTSPWSMYGITMSGMSSSGMMLTPMRLSTLGWSNLLAMLHSLMNSLAVQDVRSVREKLQRSTVDQLTPYNTTSHCLDGYFSGLFIISIPALVHYTKLSCTHNQLCYHPMVVSSYNYVVIQSLTCSIILTGAVLEICLSGFQL